MFRTSGYRRSYSYGTSGSSRSYQGGMGGRLPRPPETTWRDSNDVRSKYFHKNKGIGGRLYVCSQCFKPMLNKRKIQIDHIFPPSRVAGRSRNSIFARCLNHTFNCVSICAKCNRSKSNKLGMYQVKGSFSKIAFTAIEIASNLVPVVLSYSVFGSLYVAKSALGIISKMIFRR